MRDRLPETSRKCYKNLVLKLEAETRCNFIKKIHQVLIILYFHDLTIIIEVYYIFNVDVGNNFSG